MSNSVASLLIGLLAVDLIVALVLLAIYVMRLRRTTSETPVVEPEEAKVNTQELFGIPEVEESATPDVMRTPVPLGSVEAVQIRTTLRACIDVLRAVIEDDLEERVDISVDLTLAMSDELNELGYYLNTALDHVNHKFEQVEQAHLESATIQDAWETYAQESDVVTGFRYERDHGVEVDEDIWLTSMTEATKTLRPATQQGELALPLAVGDEVIGALGLQRDASQPWSEDELLLIQDVVDQLTQTIDRLRLVDDVSRRAALEQTSSAVTANIRSEVEIEGVLRRALAELGQALQADSGSVYLTIDPQQETVQ